MGYNTAYNLKIEAQEKNAQKEISLGKLIDSAESGDISQTDLIKYLKVLKDNPEQTKFSIDVNTEDILAELRAENDSAKYALSKKGTTSEHCTWYEHDSELKAFSKKYPDYIFTLRGDGEESGDIWIKYFMNGKMQVANAKITFDSFDKDKLK